MADQRIRVEINPDGEQSATAVDVREKPSIATSGVNLKKIAAIGLVANAGRQIGMSTLGQVGAITGNAQTQRTINRITKLGGIGATFYVNPLVGALALATTIGTEAISAGIKIRNENNSTEYYRKVNGRRIDKGRIK